MEKHKDNEGILITGHSLGGAIATIFAADLISIGYDNTIIYTFGAPRVGNSQFTDWFWKYHKGVHFRVTQKRDPIP